MAESDSNTDLELQDIDSTTSKDDELELCRICKTDVPKAYIPEHVESIIHKTNMNIIKVALDRSKEHLDNYKKWKPCIIQPTEEFCEACNEVYDYLDFAKHAETERHKKLIVYQKILPRMYQLYNDTDNNLRVIDEIDLIFKKYESKPTERVIDKDGKTYCEICDVYKSTAGFDGHLRGNKHKKNCLKNNMPVPDVKKQKKEEKYCETCGVYKSANGFDAHLNSKKHKKKLHKLNKDDPIEEDEENTDTFNFDKITEGHEKYITASYISQKKLCKICQAQLQDDEEIIKEHMNTFKHLLAYEDILINYNITKVDKEYFCVDCDIFFTDVIEHKIKHPLKGVKYLGYNQEYCELCKVIVPGSGKDVHDNGAKHKQNQKIRRKKNITFIDIELGDIDKEFLTVVEKNLTCRLCKVMFSTKHSIVSHIEGLNHKYEIDDYARMNSMELKNDAFCCKVCNEPVERNEVLKHVKHSEHKWKVFV